MADDIRTQNKNIAGTVEQEVILNGTGVTTEQANNRDALSCSPQTSSMQINRQLDRIRHLQQLISMASNTTDETMKSILEQEISATRELVRQESEAQMRESEAKMRQAEAKMRQADSQIAMQAMEQASGLQKRMCTFLREYTDKDAQSRYSDLLTRNALNQINMLVVRSQPHASSVATTSSDIATLSTRYTIANTRTIPDNGARWTVISRASSLGCIKSPMNRQDECALGAHVSREYKAFYGRAIERKMPQESMANAVGYAVNAYTHVECEQCVDNAIRSFFATHNRNTSSQANKITQHLKRLPPA